MGLMTAGGMPGAMRYGLEPFVFLDSAPTSDKPEIERLRAKNPAYEDLARDWELYVDAYDGGSAMTQHKHLFKHSRENDTDYNDRVRRLHYTNICAQLVDFYTNFIFTEPIQRDGGTNKIWFTDFSKDVDRKGTSLPDFMKQFSTSLQIYGQLYVLVDSPLAPDGVEPTSKYDEQVNGIRPYWVLMPPPQVLDWITDEFDRFLYLKRFQTIRVLPDGKVGLFEKYTEFNQSSITITYIECSNTQEPKLLSEYTQVLPNKIGIVPVFSAVFKRSEKNTSIGLSFLRDLAPNNREVMNLTSLLQEFLYRQCFNILAIETASGIPTADQTEGDIGTSNTLEYPKGAHPPQYISPPSNPAQFVQSERERIIKTMFTQAAQDTMNELFNGEKSSGFSQAQSFSKTVPFIATRADTLEMTEKALLTLTLKYSGIDAPFDGKIKYKDRYELTSLTDAMTQLMVIFRDLFIPSPTFVKEELKRVVREFDDKLPDAVAKAIEDEIDAFNFEDWQQTQKEALIGKGVSPANSKNPNLQAQ